MCSHFIGVMAGVQALDPPVQVRVAHRGKLWSTHIIPNCQWLCEGVTFSTDFKLLPLSGYDLIPGMDWLEHHSPMSIHWGHKWLEFGYKGKRVKLQGVLPIGYPIPSPVSVLLDCSWNLWFDRKLSNNY